jgi:CheY-like chemotaxis protein
MPAPAPRLRDSTIPGSAHILLAHTDVAVRLTLKAVLEKSGYRVESAASSAEAMEKIEKGQYTLILCDLNAESDQASRNVVKMAQTQEYRPATAYLTASQDRMSSRKRPEEMLIAPVNIPALLTQITDLIASRAAGRAQRAVRRMHALSA